MPIYGAVALNIVVTVVIAAAAFAVWVANRKRIAAETVGRAEEQALRTITYNGAVQLGDLPGIGFRYDADALERYVLSDA